MADVARVDGADLAARGALVRALGTLVEAPAPEHAHLAELLGLPPVPDAADHTTLFVLNLYPYASVHLGAQGMLGGEAGDRVAGFWRALGLTPPAEADHLGALLGLLAGLAEREASEEDPARRALLGEARRALLWEHLLPWVPPFLLKVDAFGHPFYAAWARLLGDVLAEAWAEAEATCAPALPAHLAGLPPLIDPREHREGGAAAFVEGLLAPARSGMIVTRHDLARAGRELGLGVRMGERAYVLKALLSQDASPTLGWLAQAAARAAASYEGMGPSPVITAFWRERARATGALLNDLASQEAHPSWTSPETAAQPTEAHRV